MSADAEAPRYWLDLFTEETWLEAARRKFTISGFTQKRWATVQRIRPNDRLVCYLTGRSTYIGLLQVTGLPFLDETPIWASQVFPSRLPVSPELLLRPDAGILVHSLRDQLSYFHNLTSPHAWTGHFRGSPAAIKPEDAAIIEAALRSAAADPARLLDLANLPVPTQRRRRKRQLAAPMEEMPRPAEEDISALSQPLPTVRAFETEEEALAKRLIQAATTSDDAAGFEVALADAFAYLGFRTERRSGPGDTDVLAVAPLGEEAYAAVVDGKASRQGRVGNAQVDWFALERHKERHGADHILVVAPGFSGGELTRDAERTGAALLTAGDLAEVLRLHAVAPFTLPALRDLFRYPGKPDVPLTRMREHARETRRLHQLLPDILDAVIEAYQYELYDPVNADALLLPLATRRRGRAYSREEITAALELLCVPQLGILRRVGDSRYVLQMPKETLTRRLRALVAVLVAPADDASAADRGQSLFGDL
jgi:hypothetical protein